MLTTGAVNTDIETRLNYIQCCLSRETLSLSNKLAIGTSCEKEWLWLQFASAALETFKDYRLTDNAVIEGYSEGCYASVDITLPTCSFINEYLERIFSLAESGVTSTIVLNAGEFTFTWIPEIAYTCEVLRDYVNAFNETYSGSGVYMSIVNVSTAPVITLTFYPNAGYSEAELNALIASMTLDITYTYIDINTSLTVTEVIPAVVGEPNLYFCEGWDTTEVLQNYNTCNIDIEDFEKLIQFLNQRCKECLPQYTTSTEDCNCIQVDSLEDLITDDEENIEY